MPDFPVQSSAHSPQECTSTIVENAATRDDTREPWSADDAPALTGSLESMAAVQASPALPRLESLTAETTTAAFSSAWPISTNAELRIVTCTHAVASALGHEPCELKDKLVLAVLAPEGVPPSGNLDFEALRSRLLTKHGVNRARILVNAGRGYRRWDVQAVPRQGPTSQFSGYSLSVAAAGSDQETQLACSSHYAVERVRDIEVQLDAVVDDASRDGTLAAALFIIQLRDVLEIVPAHRVGAIAEMGRAVAARVRKIHPHAILGQMHGNQLICVLPAIANPVEAERKGTALLHELDALLSGIGSSPQLSISGAHTATAGGSLQTLIDQAEAALTEVNLGRSQLAIFSNRSQMPAPLEVSCRIERMLERKALSLRYSAIHDSATHNIISLIASLHWADEVLSSLPAQTVAGLTTPDHIKSLLSVLKPEVLSLLDDTEADLPVFYPASFALKGGAEAAANLGYSAASARIGYVAGAPCDPEDVRSLCRLAAKRHPILISRDLAALDPVIASMATGILVRAYDGNGIVPAPADQPGKSIAIGVGALSAVNDLADAGYTNFSGLKATRDLPANKILKAISVFNRRSTSEFS